MRKGMSNVVGVKVERRDMLSQEKRRQRELKKRNINKNNNINNYLQIFKWPTS